MHIRPDQPTPVLRLVCRFLDSAVRTARVARRGIRGYSTVDRFASRGRDFVSTPTDRTRMSPSTSETMST